jgi:hypothetical protein
MFGQVADLGERRSALLESVLGATPQEFESPILRHPNCDDAPNLTAGPGMLPGGRALRSPIFPP